MPKQEIATELEIKLRIADLAIMLYSQEDNIQIGGEAAWAWENEQENLIEQLLERRNEHEAL